VGLRVRVGGFTAAGSAWEETTSCVDVSFAGVALTLSQPLESGQVLRLSLPMPRELRRYDVDVEDYQTYGLVRYVAVGPKPARVGVMFLGRTAPSGYVSSPGGIFLLPSTTAREFRRYEVQLRVRLRRIEAPGAVDSEAEILNIGQGGAMIRTALAVPPQEVVFIEQPGGVLRTGARVQGVGVAEDGRARLQVRFLAPDAGRQVQQILRREGFMD